MPAHTSSSQMTTGVGAHLVVELIDSTGGSERLEFDIVPDKMADFPHGFLGESTPLARAVQDRPAGALVSYQLEEIIQVRILSVSASKSLPAADTAAPRQQAMDEARRQVERTSAVLFASSFSGKWGDYDPEGIDHWDEPSEDPSTPRSTPNTGIPDNPSPPPADR